MPRFYQTRSACSMHQGSIRIIFAVYKLSIMLWCEAGTNPPAWHKISNCRGTLVDRGWFTVHPKSMFLYKGGAKMPKCIWCYFVWETSSVNRWQSRIYWQSYCRIREDDDVKMKRETRVKDMNCVIKLECNLACQIECSRVTVGTGSACHLSLITSV